MNFEHPWVLLAVLLPLAWAAWEWRGSQRRAALLLKAGAFAAIVLALAEPRLIVFERKVAVAVLADTSASIPPQDLVAESALADKLDRSRGANWVRVIPFARATRLAAAEEHPKDRLGPAPHRRRRAAMPPTWKRPFATASARCRPAWCRACWWSPTATKTWAAFPAPSGRRSGSAFPSIPWLCPAAPSPGLLLESVGFPGQVFSGERFPIEVTIASPRDAEATVEISAEGKSIGNNRVALAEGENHLRLQASVNSAGAIALAGKISAQGLGEAHFEDAITLRSPRVLLVSHDPESSEEHLVRTLEANQFAVERSPERHSAKSGRLSAGRHQQLEPGIDSRSPAGGARGFRQTGRRAALDRRRARRLRGKEGRREPAGAHPAGQAGPAAHARRHRRGADHRQVVIHGGPQDRAGALRRHRGGG